MKHRWAMNEPFTHYVCTGCGMPLTVRQMYSSRLRDTPCGLPERPRKGWFAEAVLPSARRNPA